MSKAASPLVVIAHAVDAEEAAAAITKELQASGLAVESQRLDRNSSLRLAPSGRISTTQRLIVLWSNAAARSPELRRTADRAKRAGALRVVRLDATPLPAGFGRFSIRLRPGRARTYDWSRLMETPETDEPRNSNRMHALLVVLLLGLVAAFAAYEANPVFAAQIDRWAGAARAQVLHLARAVKG